VDKDARIGIFICRCGGKIDSAIDVERLKKEISTLPEVADIQIMNYPCSIKGREDIKKLIKDKNLSQIVIAGCTPRTHHKLFSSLCREIGLSGSAFDMANIREQCALVHQANTESIFEKAFTLIKMAVAKVSHIMPESKREIIITRSAAVIGGGIAGMHAALTLSKRGYPVSLIEKEKELGGMLKDLYALYPDFTKTSELLKELVSQIKKQSNIKIYANAEIKNISGHIGNYKINILCKGKKLSIESGSIIVATGAKELEPEGLFNYDKKKVITQLQLEKKFKEDMIDFSNIVMIQCVGCRNEERTYCSRICCTTAAKNALIIKEKNPNAQVTILFRDIPIDYEELFHHAKKMRIHYIRYSHDKPPTVKTKKVVVNDLLSGKNKEIDYDLIVLSTPLIPQQDAAALAKQLKIPVDDDGFFPQVHTMLKPEDFISNGIFICGTAHWPSFYDETVFQAKLAASKAIYLLSKERIELDGPVCIVQEELCRGCGDCVEVCEFNAPILIEKSAGVFVSNINPALCNACGTCASLCPTGAIIDSSFTDKQISNMLDLLLTSSS
jgi:heterodisulfide reductase subunit A